MPAPELRQRLLQLTADGPAVIAHRGDSATYPENTQLAFAAAVQLGVPLIEFDVQTTADGQLVCLHDACLDRTSDASTHLGPGAQIQHLRHAEVQRLDTGTWKHPRFAGARIPTLEEALGTMLPRVLPMIEHKAGTASQYVELLRRLDVVDDVLLQSFDWQFVAAARALEPRLTLGLLGPHRHGERPDDTAFAVAAQLHASFVHWSAHSLSRADVARIHRAGMLCFTYTTDDELGWHGGRALGIDGMCTNTPGAMQAWRREAPR